MNCVAGGRGGEGGRGGGGGGGVIVGSVPGPIDHTMCSSPLGMYVQRLHGL